MKTTSRFLAGFQIGAALFLAQANALADIPALPYDYTAATEGEKHVFVMLGSKYGIDEKIRAAYKQSGLYPKGSRVPLWTVGWYAFQVIPSSDGRHLVQMGPWASDTRQLAVAFHRDGKEIRSYRIKELVRDESKLRRTSFHFFWLVDARYDDKRGVLFLKTIDGHDYRFSLTSGEMLPKSANSPLPRKSHRWRTSEQVSFTFSN